MLIGNSSQQWAGGLCKMFLLSGNYQDIMNALTTVKALDNQLRKVASCQWSSRGEKLEHPLSRNIRYIMKALEDLLVNAMEGMDVSDLVRRGLLLYQVVPDVTL